MHSQPFFPKGDVALSLFGDGPADREFNLAEWLTNYLLFTTGSLHNCKASVGATLGTCNPVVLSSKTPLDHLDLFNNSRIFKTKATLFK